MRRFFESVGRRTVDGWRAQRDNLEFLGETFAAFGSILVHPRRFRFGDAALAFQRAAFDGLPVTTGIGFLLGVILAFESAAALQMFGVEVYVADLLAIGLFRELGPLVTAIVLAGRSGSAFAAEIASMKADEELDALTTMGLPPVRFLVPPRIAAGVFAMPILTIAAELAGLVGGAVVLQMMDVPTAVFWEHVTDTADAFMISFGLVKSAIFGFIVGIVGCAAGMRTAPTADGVGTAATRAVVGGIVSIAVADGLIAVLCHLWGV
ncbi:MAG: ABC transporter permease [Kiritimatiellae bacterium]|nr:ABC transporter permease [Kiritimatiellia bacterium]